jgi:RimJ/RimL family protein N-acetyltransferase
MEDGGRVLVLSPEEGMIAHMARGECVIGVRSGNDMPPLPGGCYLVDEEESVDAAFADRVYARFRHKPWKIGENDTFLLREFSADDIERLYLLEQEMQAYPAVSGILGELTDTPWAELPRDRREALTGTLSSYIEHQYAFYEYGLWGICLISEDRLIGMCGFSVTEEGEPSLGYYISPSYRGRGIATQCCRMALDFVETWVQAEEVSAQIDRENFASLCIVRSLGFVEMKGDGQCLEFRKTLAGDKTDPESPEAGALWEKILSAAGKQFRR